MPLICVQIILSSSSSSKKKKTLSVYVTFALQCSYSVKEFSLCRVWAAPKMSRVATGSGNTEPASNDKTIVFPLNFNVNAPFLHLFVATSPNTQYFSCWIKSIGRTNKMFVSQIILNFRYVAGFQAHRIRDIGKQSSISACYVTLILHMLKDTKKGITYCILCL